MNDIVAVEVEMESGEQKYCLTWGRIQHPKDPRFLEELVLWLYRNETQNDSAAVSAKVLPDLAQVSRFSDFLKHFYRMAPRIPADNTEYTSWRNETAERMLRGEEIWFLTA